MQNAKVLPVIGLIMVVGAVALSYAVPRLPVPNIQRLPVETFPRNVADWASGPDREVDPYVQNKIPTAKIVSRTYTNKPGKSVELTLLSASQRADFHNPNECFPGQGWALSNHHRVEVDGQRFNVMSAQKDGENLIVYYCWMGERDVKKPSTVVQRTMLDIRDRVFTGIMDRADGMSLFVRVLAKDDEAGRKSVSAFAAHLLPKVRIMLAQGV